MFNPIMGKDELHWEPLAISPQFYLAGKFSDIYITAFCVSGYGDGTTETIMASTDCFTQERTTIKNGKYLIVKLSVSVDRK
jgi:hypothetical protein